MSPSAWTRTLVVAATVILLGVIVVGVIWLLSWISSIVLLLLLSGLFSIVLMPLVDWFARFKHMPRPLAVLLSYVCVMIVVGAVLEIIIPPLFEQANQLVQSLPRFLQEATSPDALLTRTMERFGVDLKSALSGAGAQAQDLAKAVLSNAATVVRDITTIAVGIIVVMVFCFYLLNEGHTFRANLQRIVPTKHREKADFLVESVVAAVGGYVRAQITVALMVGALAGLASWLIQIRFPLIIGVLAGLLELIPFFGPTLGAIPAVIIAAFQGSWIKVGLIIVAFIIIQQIESNIIGPRIMAHGVGLHPLVVIVVVLIGIELAGVWGALFAVPTAATIVAIGRRIYRANRPPPRSIAA
jgi:predicted PurR-regulated permease PerM